MPESQSYRNHGRIVPVYHVGVFFILVANFFWSVYQLMGGISAASVLGVLLATGLLLMFFSVRVQILTVQDRVIRLEMRLRLNNLLPADLARQAAVLPVKQLVALRFAGDDELPGLVEEVLAGRLATPKDIKMRVKNWQGDFLRA